MYRRAFAGGLGGLVMRSALDTASARVGRSACRVVKDGHGPGRDMAVVAWRTRDGRDIGKWICHSHRAPPAMPIKAASDRSRYGFPRSEEFRTRTNGTRANGSGGRGFRDRSVRKTMNTRDWRRPRVERSSPHGAFVCGPGMRAMASRPGRTGSFPISPPARSSAMTAWSPFAIWEPRRSRSMDNSSLPT